ncbi:glutamine--tRNA ligase/YqeY domain fusion protein [Paenibacillus aquistagni]|uniref:glutamine--tRNA ligase/YqeY domain fusion protein n=1 Tax=Paenibacillus aquistagni TaxID=1852522 RepID=UPI000B509CD5|nr:glutamine--tRNA ligase/YqeY domain fusion protein [Paenibacillus aquistagni]
MKEDIQATHPHAFYTMIKEDCEHQVFHRPICTRFPPEPNGYLHIGSAYAIHMNASLAKAFDGEFHLRFDDTNPLKEDEAFVQAILQDIRWLGYDPGPHIYYGSDYAETIYEAALKLIERGAAYVCDLSAEDTAIYRGTLTESGKESPYRNRSVEENRQRFEAMRAGQYASGACVLRAKIDMASANMNMRDPILFRIIHASHYRTGDSWCIYPMYDFAHPIQDWIEGVTHSLCSIEFKDHRPLYEWVQEQLELAEPSRQREFGRLYLQDSVTSKRYLRQLVERGDVDGWDDPRLATVMGMRRRGYQASHIRQWMAEIGLIRHEAVVDLHTLDHITRADLQGSTKGYMTILDPIKLIITNRDQHETEWLDIPFHTEHDVFGSRAMPFTRELFIEREDFMEVPEQGYRRLTLGGEVRLKGAYYVHCHHVVKDELTGNILELHCTYDPKTKSGSGFEGRKVKGTIHWVAASDAVPLEVRLYHSLLRSDAKFNEKEPDWSMLLNPHSLVTYKNAIAEGSLSRVESGERVQFVRHGYFIEDMKDSSSERKVYNRIVALKDSWKK